MAENQKPVAPIVPIAERLACGNLTVKEVRALAGNVSNSKFYDDLKAGRVVIRKLGRKSVVPGPVAAAYARGEAVPAEFLASRSKEAA